ncbi:phage protein [Escherichia coli KTE57]|nr:phage protein [Escherichia coli KTE57]
MATLTKKEQAWLNELQDVLDRCPSPKKIGFYTIGDKSIYLYDLRRMDEIMEALDNRSSMDWCVKWSTKTGHRVRVFSSIDFPIRLVVTHHYIRAVLVRCNIQRYSPLLRELHR